MGWDSRPFTGVWDVHEVSEVEGRALLAAEMALAKEISIGLHDLCQPLTALQCRLELGKMDATAEGMEAAIADALAECARLNDMVRAMQDRVLHPARHHSVGAL